MLEKILFVTDNTSEIAPSVQPISQNVLIGIVVVTIIILVGLGYWYAKPRRRSASETKTTET